MLRKQVIISSLWCRDLLVILAIPLLRYEFLITLSPMGIPVIYFFLSLRIYSISSTLCVPRYHCRFLPVLELSHYSSHFLSIHSLPPYPWYLLAILVISSLFFLPFLSSSVHGSRFLSVLSFPFCPHQCLVLISSLPVIPFLSSSVHGSHFLSIL